MIQDMRIRYRNSRSGYDPDMSPRYDYYTFYEKIFNYLKPGRYPYYMVLCPFHKDDIQSMSINVVNGRFKCFGCGHKGGAWDFIIEKLHKQGIVDAPGFVTDPEQIRKMEEADKKMPEPPSELVLAVEERRAEIAHDYLFRQPFAMRYLTRDRGLSYDSIRQWRIGFLQGAITIPIPDMGGHLATLKVHKKYQTQGAINQLYPWDAVLNPKYKYIVLVEGELDMMIVRQHGFNAVTQILGANSWEDRFTRYFMNKIIYIAYDNDAAGKKAAAQRAEEFEELRVRCGVIKWPQWMQEKEDNTDFFVKYKMSDSAYENLLSNSIRK